MGNVHIFANLIVFQMIIFFLLNILTGEWEKCYAAADYCITMGALSVVDLSKRILSPRKFRRRIRKRAQFQMSCV